VSAEGLPSSGPASATPTVVGLGGPLPSCESPHIDLSENQIEDISALVDLAWLDAGWHLSLTGNLLDVSDGSLAMQTIEALRARGVIVCF